MSPAETPPVETPPPLPVLSVNERRVLGVLVEKAKTTPDTYPLSINSLVTGSNQKSNRDPILDLNDLDVEEALANCQQKKLVIRITGGSRVERWKHNLYEAWKLEKVDLAIVGELLLRGAQTEGELRGRASRMEPIDDLDTLRNFLRRLAERKLVVYLTPEGRRGTTLTHGFHTPKELERLRSAHPHEDEPPLPAPSAPAPPVPQAAPAKPSGLEAQVATLQLQVAELQTQVATLTEQVRSLKEALGV